MWVTCDPTIGCITSQVMGGKRSGVDGQRMARWENLQFGCGGRSGYPQRHLWTGSNHPFGEGIRYPFFWHWSIDRVQFNRDEPILWEPQRSYQCVRLTVEEHISQSSTATIASESCEQDQGSTCRNLSSSSGKFRKSGKGFGQSGQSSSHVMVPFRVQRGRPGAGGRGIHGEPPFEEWGWRLITWGKKHKD